MTKGPAPRPLVRWLCVAVGAAAILLFSTDLGSSGRTGSFAMPVLERLGLSQAVASAIHAVLRALGHMTAYAGFAMLVWWASVGRPRRTVTAFAGALALAVVDETLQAMAPQRAGEPTDVLLDLLGAGIALALLALRRSRERARPPASGN